MSAFDDINDYEEEATLNAYLDEELRQLAHDPVFAFLAHNGDAIEQRVRSCLDEAAALAQVGFYGAALTRAVIGIEIAIKFFVVRPLLQGVFLSDVLAEDLIEKLVPRRNRMADERDLMKKLLRNWKIDIELLKLPSGGQLWEAIEQTWKVRDDYTHKATGATESQANVAIECLSAFLSEVVAPIAKRLGFTRDQTGRWSTVLSANPPEFPDLNPPRQFEQRVPKGL